MLTYDQMPTVPAVVSRDFPFFGKGHRDKQRPNPLRLDPNPAMRSPCAPRDLASHPPRVAVTASCCICIFYMMYVYIYIYVILDVYGKIKTRIK